MEKNIVDTESSTGKEHVENPDTSKAMDGSKLEGTDVTLQAATETEPQTDYSSKAKNHTTFSHYWVS